MLIYTTAVLAASLVIAADDAAPQNEVAKLRTFFGNWEARIANDQGQIERVCFSGRPILGRRFVELRAIALDDTGKVTFELLDILGQDPVDGKLKFWEFDSQGGVGQLVLASWEGQKCEWSLCEARPDRSARKGTVCFEFSDRESYKWSAVWDDGQKREATIRRTPPKKDLWPEWRLETPQGASDLMKEVGWWAAITTSTGNDPFSGQNGVGKCRCLWALGGKLLVSDGVSVRDDLKVASYRAIIGVDPVTNKVTGWEFDGAGTVGKYVVSKQGQDVQGKAVSPDAGVLEYQGRMKQMPDGIDYLATGKLPDGKTVNYHWVWTKEATKK